MIYLLYADWSMGKSTVYSRFKRMQFQPIHANTVYLDYQNPFGLRSIDYLSTNLDIAVINGIHCLTNKLDDTIRFRTIDVKFVYFAFNLAYIDEIMDINSDHWFIKLFMVDKDLAISKITSYQRYVMGLIPDHIISVVDRAEFTQLFDRNGLKIDQLEAKIYS